MHTYIYAYIHIYIHNWLLQPFHLVSHTTLCCVLILYMRGGTYSLKSIPNDRFLGIYFNAILFYSAGKWNRLFKTFHGNFIYSQIFSQKSDERNSRKKYFFIFCFVEHVWPGVWNVASSKSIYYLLDCGDFKRIYS